MNSSPYLAEALQALGQPQAEPAQPGVDPQVLLALKGKREAYQQSNPGQAYLPHALGEAGQALMRAPQNAMMGLRGLFGLGAAAQR